MDTITIDFRKYLDAQTVLDQLSLIEKQLLRVEHYRQGGRAYPKNFSEIYEVTYSFFENILASRKDGQLILDIDSFRSLISYYNTILEFLTDEQRRSQTADQQDRIDYIIENIRVVKDNLFAIFHLSEEDLNLSQEA